jgi:hypothetical protein
VSIRVRFPGDEIGFFAFVGVRINELDHPRALAWVSALERDRLLFFWYLTSVARPSKLLSVMWETVVQ